jgi:signal transduction histidine kinase
MSQSMDCPLAEVLARRLRDARDDLTRRWLDRISARVTLDKNRIFPTEDLLDHIPLLVDGIADYMEDPADEISAEMPVVAKAAELGELRLSQGFSASQILKEYEILGGVLFSYLIAAVDSIEEECTRGELLACGQRLFRAIAVVQQVTTGHYLRIADKQVHEKEERLRSFNRMVTHELKGGLTAVRGAASMLQEPWVRDDPEQRQRFLDIIARGADAMDDVLADLLTLSRTHSSARKQHHVLLREAVAEAARQLREMARKQGVEIRLSEDLPRVEVDAAAVELCLTNYISNGIKYADPRESSRWVEVDAYWSDEAETDPEVIIEVRDNGVGVPAAAQGRLFERFFRSERAAGVDGTGLGLNIVRETVEMIGGRAWAEFPPHDDTRGSVFKLALPARRDSDEERDDESDAGAGVAGEPPRTD